jgi:pimeloyl-ACP methyl ester carboxylesterase
MDEPLELRIHGDQSLPALVYLPGLHGDWTLVTSFRAAVTGKVRFIEVTYPRTTEWSLDDYARHIHSALASRGIARGWLLAESFGSQVAWAMLGRAGGGFEAEGLVLAGGFVRHPTIWGVWLARFMTAHYPDWSLRLLLAVYALYAGFRHRHAPETRGCIAEFVARRRHPLDRPAIVHRLELIARNDPRPIAGRTRLPVFSLVGLIDPIVPALPVWLWCRRRCPGYRASRLIWRADHNVLGTAPDQSAHHVLRWMQDGQETNHPT